MKIDAEGAEIAILRGARDSINKFKPYICFEYHSGDLQGLSEFSNFFAGLDYVMYKINVEKDKISHTRNYDSTYFYSCGDTHTQEFS